MQRDPPPPDDEEQEARSADAEAFADAMRKADPRLRSGSARPRWRDPRDLAAEQAAESRAARAEAEAEAAAAELGEADQEESRDESQSP